MFFFFFTCSTQCTSAHTPRDRRQSAERDEILYSTETQPITHRTDTLAGGTTPDEKSFFRARKQECASSGRSGRPPGGARCHEKQPERYQREK